MRFIVQLIPRPLISVLWYSRQSAIGNEFLCFVSLFFCFSVIASLTNNPELKRICTVECQRLSFSDTIILVRSVQLTTIYTTMCNAALPQMANRPSARMNRDESCLRCSSETLSLSLAHVTITIALRSKCIVRSVSFYTASTFCNSMYSVITPRAKARIRYNV